MINEQYTNSLNVLTPEAGHVNLYVDENGVPSIAKSDGTKEPLVHAGTTRAVIQSLFTTVPVNSVLGTHPAGKADGYRYLYTGAEPIQIYEIVSGSPALAEDQLSVGGSVNVIGDEANESALAYHIYVDKFGIISNPYYGLSNDQYNTRIIRWGDMIAISRSTDAIDGSYQYHSSILIIKGWTQLGIESYDLIQDGVDNYRILDMAVDSENRLWVTVETDHDHPDTNGDIGKIVRYSVSDESYPYTEYKVSNASMPAGFVNPSAIWQHKVGFMYVAQSADLTPPVDFNCVLNADGNWLVTVEGADGDAMNSMVVEFFDAELKVEYPFIYSAGVWSVIVPGEVHIEAITEEEVSFRKSVTAQTHKLYELAIGGAWSDKTIFMNGAIEGAGIDIPADLQISMIRSSLIWGNNAVITLASRSRNVTALKVSHTSVYQIVGSGEYGIEAANSFHVAFDESGDMFYSTYRFEPYSGTTDSFIYRIMTPESEVISRIVSGRNAVYLFGSNDRVFYVDRVVSGRDEDSIYEYNKIDEVFLPSGTGYMFSSAVINIPVGTLPVVSFGMAVLSDVPEIGDLGWIAGVQNALVKSFNGDGYRLVEFYPNGELSVTNY